MVSSVAIGGTITFMIILVVMAVLMAYMNDLFLESLAKSENNKITNSISKTQLDINSIESCSGNDLVNVHLENTGNEKLSEFEKFNVLVTYDADIGGIKTRVTENFDYNVTAFAVSQGQSVTTKKIPHAYVEVLSQMNTNDSNYIDMPGANLSRNNFDINKKYLIYVTGQMTGSNADDVYSIRLVHGNTPFDGSEYSFEPFNTVFFDTYAWFTVWEPTTVAESNEDVKLQYRRAFGGGGSEGRFDQITMFAVEISERFTEDTDWFFNENTIDTALTTAWSTNNNATITFTPDCPNNTWLVLATAQIDTDTANRRYETRLLANGGATTNVDNISKETKDTNDGFLEVFPETIAFSYDIPSVATTFTSQSQSEGGNSGIRHYSAVFAMNLDKFQKHNLFSSPSPINIGTVPDWVTEIVSLDFTPDEAGDVWVLGYFIGDRIPDGAFLDYHARMQVYETGKTQVDQPPSQTNDLYRQNEPSDNTGEQEWSIQTVEHFEPIMYTADIDADVTSTGVSFMYAEYRTLGFVSLITDECVGGDSGNNILVNEWTFNCIMPDELDSGILNPGESGELLLKLGNQIFPDGEIEIVIATENGQTVSKSIVVP